MEGARRRHEVATPLAELLDSGRLTTDILLPIIDAHEVEADPSIDTLIAWRTWLLAGAGGIAVAAAHLLGVPDPESFRPFGAAYGAGRVIRSVQPLAIRGRCLLPADLLEAAGISVHRAIATPQAPEVASVVSRLTTEGRDFLAQSTLRRLPRAYVAAALPVVLARRDLRRDPDPTPRRLADRLAVTWAGLTGWV